MRKTMAQIQEEVDQYISQFKEGYFSPLAMLARLTEELGELAREINHYYGEKPKSQVNKQRQWKKNWVIYYSFLFVWRILYILIWNTRMML